MTLTNEAAHAALEQLEWAAILYLDHGAFRSAATLAGAADELLGKPLAESAAMQLLKRWGMDVSGEDECAVVEILNGARNWLKHGGAADSARNWQGEAGVLIIRAAINLTMHRIQPSARVWEAIKHAESAAR